MDEFKGTIKKCGDCTDLHPCVRHSNCWNSQLQKFAPLDCLKCFAIYHEACQNSVNHLSWWKNRLSAIYKKHKKLFPSNPNKIWASDENQIIYGSLKDYDTQKNVISWDTSKVIRIFSSIPKSEKDVRAKLENFLTTSVSDVPPPSRNQQNHPSPSSNNVQTVVLPTGNTSFSVSK